MLILTRKLNESIIIGDKTEIVITDISKESVKIGIKAPKSISVHRKEVYEAIKSEMSKAAKSDVSGLKKLKTIDSKSTNK